MLKLALLLTIAPTLAQASPPLEDAFFAYAKARKIEQQLKLLPLQEEMNPADRALQARELDAALTEARISFHAVLRSDHATLDPWEEELLQKVAAKKKTGLTRFSAEHLTYLQETFPEAENLSPLEWALLEEWFGKPTATAFLRTAFHAQELPREGETRKARLLFLADPYKKENPAALAELKRAGHDVEVLRLTPFARLDDLAEELRHALAERKGEPTFLVSEGDASAVMLRMLDLAPRMRRAESLAGWINVNGRLYGEAKLVNESAAPGPARAKGRGLASVAHGEQAAPRLAAESRARAAALRLESLERPAPLGEGFPILNLVSPVKDANFREALVTGSRSWLAGPGSAFGQVGEALRYVAVPFSRR